MAAGERAMGEGVEKKVDKEEVGEGEKEKEDEKEEGVLKGEGFSF